MPRRKIGENDEKVYSSLRSYEKVFLMKKAKKCIKVKLWKTMINNGKNEHEPVWTTLTCYSGLVLQCVSRICTSLNLAKFANGSKV